MDIRCPVCREPWDHDSLHEEVSYRHGENAGRDSSGKYDQNLYQPLFDEVRIEFYNIGCKALTCMGSGSHCIKPSEGRSAGIDAIYDLMGDDIDGAMSMLDDFGDML